MENAWSWENTGISSPDGLAAWEKIHAQLYIRVDASQLDFTRTRRLAGCNKATRSLKVAVSIRQPPAAATHFSPAIGTALAQHHNFRDAAERRGETKRRYMRRITYQELL